MSLFIETALIVIFVIVAHVIVYLWIRKAPKKSIRDRHVVITGGSSGIGLAIAMKCVKLGADVTIIARNLTNLENAQKQISVHRVNDNQKIQFRSLDLSKNYRDVEKCLTELEENAGQIYMLINCAGMAICGTVDGLSIDDAKKMIDINYWATYFPTRFALGRMKQIGDGILVLTGSQASLLGIYGYGAYSAAKFALRGLAETIAMEVSNTEISVTLALPADTDTPGFANENLTKPEITKIISASGGLADPVKVAEKLLNDALTGEFISICGMESWLLTLICSGMSPWRGLSFAILQSIILGPLRLVAYGIQYNFKRIVRKNAVPFVQEPAETDKKAN